MENQLIQLAEQMGAKLHNQSLRLATAESCTGGYLAQMITAVPNSSQWFDRGFVTYSNQAKQDMLEVDEHLLDRYGAVSPQVAVAMAQGALKHSMADIAIAITGIAGPGGGSAMKPVGLVYFAWIGRSLPLAQAEQVFIGDRQQIRRQAVQFAMYQCLKRLD